MATVRLVQGHQRELPFWSHPGVGVSPRGRHSVYIMVAFSGLLTIFTGRKGKGGGQHVTHTVS